jgi:hypothetical protein
MRTGKLALSLGFSVTIQEIPIGDWKNDPDSYLVSKDKLDELTKQDFVMWYASKVINLDGENIPQQAKAIHEVVDLVKTIPDKVLHESYTDKLINVYGHENMWKREIMGIQTMPAPVVSSAISDEEYAALFKGTEIKVGNKRYGPLSYNIAKSLSAYTLSTDAEEFLKSLKSSIMSGGHWPNNQNLVTESSY